MSDDAVAPEKTPPSDGEVQPELKGLHRWMKALFDRTPWGQRLNRHAESVRDLHQRVDAMERRVDELNDRIEGRLDVLTDRVEGRLDALEKGRSDIDRRFDAHDGRLDEIERNLATAGAEASRLRDEVVPAVADRSDALLDRLHAEIDEVGSLVERMLRGEPLPVTDAESTDEKAIAKALADVQPALLEAFRGAETEIRHRLDSYLETLRNHAPVLDLGCGRGELLVMLREAGVEAVGVEGDAAVAQTVRRRGLDVIEAPVVQGLRSLPDGSRGAVTAIHLLEHLDAGQLAAVIAEVRRVLAPGGVFVAEIPNPHSLRVGASLFWLDPTHRRPLPPETLELFLRAGGLRHDRTELCHPFPAEQLFTGAVADDELARRLDELINGPRDAVVWASKPRNNG